MKRTWLRLHSFYVPSFAALLTNVQKLTNEAA